MFTEEEGEADSFVGQVPEPSNNPFHSASGGVDPFANVGHNPFPPQPSSVPQRFNSQTPPVRSSPIPGGPLTGQMSGIGIPGMSTQSPGQIPRQSGPPPPGNSNVNLEF